MLILGQRVLRGRPHVRRSSSEDGLLARGAYHAATRLGLWVWFGVIRNEWVVYPPVVKGIGRSVQQKVVFHRPLPSPDALMVAPILAERPWVGQSARVTLRDTTNAESRRWPPQQMPCQTGTGDPGREASVCECRWRLA
jgi:hypothetical protein